MPCHTDQGFRALLRCRPDLSQCCHGPHCYRSSFKFLEIRFTSLMPCHTDQGFRALMRCCSDLSQWLHGPHRYGPSSLLIAFLLTTQELFGIPLLIYTNHLITRSVCEHFHLIAGTFLQAPTTSI